MHVFMNKMTRPINSPSIPLALPNYVSGPFSRPHSSLISTEHTVRVRNVFKITIGLVL